MAAISKPDLGSSAGPRLRLDDGLLRIVTLSAALFVLALVVLIVWQLISGGAPAFRAEGLGFFTSAVWDVPRNRYGAAAFIYGTFVSSMIALLIGGTVGVAVAAFLVELAPKWMLKPVGFLVDLLAAIPSIIYGLWGIFVLIPWLRTTLYPELALAFGWTGFFGSDGVAIPGTGLLTAGLVLAVMIIPTVAAITREVLLVVPKNMRDGALALGANRTEALKTVQMPYASGGILGALILGLGRALGETMAVAMVIGNSAMIHRDLLRPGASLASNIANEFGEARDLQRSALIGLGLVLFVVTFVLNVLARLLVSRIRKRSGLQ